jgi:hypothetical protein
MATYGQIKSDVVMSAGEIIRRNVSNTDFETYMSAAVESNPPSGKCKVVNLYVVISTGKLVVEYEDTPV